MNPGQVTNAIIAFENGDLTDDETVELFQALIDNGMAWTLQGSYGRIAMDLVNSGACELPLRRSEPTTRELVQKERSKEKQCLFCPPNKGENAKRRPKYGTRKPKGKR